MLLSLFLVIWGVACTPTQNLDASGELDAQALYDNVNYVDPPLAISGLMTVFGDQLSQWDLFDYEGERAGELRLRFPPVAGRGGDFTQWTFRLGSDAGLIRPKIAGRDDVWEVRVGDDVVIVRTLYPGQLDQWSIGDGRGRIVFAVRDYQLLEYWSTRGPGGPGNFEVYTRFEGDPRDWEIASGLTREISPAAQLAMIWLPIYMRLTASR